MKKDYELSSGEWKIMQLLWDNSPRTNSQLVAALAGDTGWSKGAVSMMLTRLIDKGAVRVEEQGRSKLYYPLWPREVVAGKETESFLSRVYQGSLSLMVAAMSGQKALTPTEIEALAAIVDQARAQQDGAEGEEAQQ